jgi:hypothetical protein
MAQNPLSHEAIWVCRIRDHDVAIGARHEIHLRNLRTSGSLPRARTTIEGPNRERRGRADPMAALGVPASKLVELTEQQAELDTRNH